MQCYKILYPTRKIYILEVMWESNFLFLVSLGYRIERKPFVVLNYVGSIKKICFQQKFVEVFGICPTLFQQTLRRPV